MAIEFVGTATVSGSGASLSLPLSSLTGGIASAPSEGDIVFVLCGGSSSKGTVAIQMVATGYTEWQAPTGRNDTYDTSISAYYKVQGGTPDTSVTVTNDSATFTISARAMVFRGVDTASLGKGALQGAANTGLPNLPSSTPTVDGSVLLDFAVAAHTSNTAAHTSSDYDLFFSVGYNGGTYDHTSSAGVKAWTSGAFDPAVYGGFAVNAQHSWSGFRTTLVPVNDPAGTAAITLGALTSSGTGDVLVDGAGAVSLGQITAAGAGAVTDVITGNAALTFGAVTVSASGGPVVSGAGDVTLGELAAAGGGDVAVEGSWAAQLDGIALSSAGEVAFGIAGSASISIGGIVVAGEGASDVSGVGLITLGQISSAGAGVADGGVVAPAGRPREGGFAWAGRDAVLGINGRDENSTAPHKDDDEVIVMVITEFLRMRARGHLDLLPQPAIAVEG